LDPFPLVAGQGAARLRAAGIGVEVGVGEAAARRLNAPYQKRLRTGRPWVHAKWAMTIDGKIATRTGESKWITGAAARARAHVLRGRVDAILIGKGTLLADDPLLTARPAGPRTAARVVLTATAEGLPESCRLLETIQDAPVLVFTAGGARERLTRGRERGADVVGPPAGTGGALDIQSVLTELGNRNMTNVLVEGGAETLGRFLDAGEIDEVHAFIAPRLVGGAAAPSPIGGVGGTRPSPGLEMTQYWVERLGLPHP